MANTVTLTFAGDSKQLERTFDNVGNAAKESAGKMDRASDDARKFGGAMDAAGGAADASESKFMGAADLLDGLGGAFGLPTEGATGMMRSFGDLSGGFATLQPLVGGLSGMLKTGLGGALSFIAAHPVIFTIAILTAAFVLLWQHSETFRDIVKGAIGGVGDAFFWLKDTISSLGGTMVGILTWPYRTAFNAISGIWNNTVGQLSFEIPSWVPGIGGKGFSMPNLPKFHTGGVVPGMAGQEVLINALAGERVTGPGGGGPGGGTQVIEIHLNGRVLQKALIDEENRSGRVWVRAS